MMLYVFHVDVGRMLTFDMHVAVSSVEKLKENIEKIHHIPAKNIVLLVSGGEMLTHSTQVSCYSAGTDTNPIYMFLTGDDRPPPTIPTLESDTEMCRQVDESLNLPANLETVRRRALLAQLMFEMARDDERQCEQHVHEQHLQQQGWSAVVANLEDLINEFKIRMTNFGLTFDTHLSQRQNHLELLKNFNEDLLTLSRIPILPGLMSLAAADFHGFDDMYETEAENAFARSQMQQELVLKAVAAAQTAATVVAAHAVAITESSSSSSTAAVGSNECAASSDDKVVTSTSSTSPNKKQKMGDDNDIDDDGDENIETTVGDNVAVASSTTATETLVGLANEVSAGSTTEATGSTTTIPAPAIPTTTTTTKDEPERASQSSEFSSSNRLSLNLLQWITSKENHNTLRNMADECIQGLQSFDENVYDRLKIEVAKIIVNVDKCDVREIKGLSDRLCRLEEIKYRIKKMVQDQKELSTAFQQNQQRARNLGDTSILPDLCASHQSQLQVMLQNHHRIRELCRCILKAKDELGLNLNLRLKHIVLLENTMSEYDNRLLFYHRCLRRAERHLNIIEQIHRAPRIYVAAVTEVVRRKIFSGEFRLWASKLAEDFETIHVEEINRRHDFNTNFEGHFLNILFPGLGDMPPAFANEIPLIFDARLPNLTKSDIEILTQYIPDLAADIQLPDMRSVIQFFVARSGIHQQERIEELVKAEVAASLNLMECGMSGGGGGGDKTLQHQRLGVLRDGSGACDESETDTETDFEKVTGGESGGATANASTSTIEPQMAIETIARSTTTDAPTMQCAETLTEENAASIRAEVTRLRNVLSSMSRLAIDCLHTARTSMSNIRADSVTYRDELLRELKTLHDHWDVLRLECVNRDQQHGVEVVELNSEIQRHEGEHQSDKTQIQSLSIRCATLEAHLEEVREQLRTAQEDKEVAVAEAREELIHEHKTEIESLRCRFKLMTSMERSPSDTSLEKLERPTSSTDQNMIDVLQHEQLMAQQRAELLAQKERAIFAALEAERTIWQSKIFPLNSESVMANVSILKDMLEDKERQLDLLREHEKIRTQENYQLKARIESLTNEEGNSWLKEKIEYLHRDKCRLEEELTMAKSKRVEMETSVVATTKGSTYERLSSSNRNISLENCNKNDLVFVVWSMRHWQFMVVQDSSTLYFVHSDSLPALNLTIPQFNPEHDNWGQIPWPYYAIGRIQDKEYCMARKDENRYRVQRGTKFYRIKLTPLNSRLIARRDEELMSVSTASVIVPVNIAAASSAAAAAAIDTTTEDITSSQTVAGDLKTESSETSAIKIDYFEASSAGAAAQIEDATAATEVDEADTTNTEILDAEAAAFQSLSTTSDIDLMTSKIDYGSGTSIHELTNLTVEYLSERFDPDIVTAATAKALKLKNQADIEAAALVAAIPTCVIKRSFAVQPEEATTTTTPTEAEAVVAASLSNMELQYQQQQQQPQLTIQSEYEPHASPVITEQPTASNLLLNVDSLLANVELEHQQQLLKERQQQEEDQQNMDGDELETRLQMEEQQQEQMLMEQDELQEEKEKLQMEQQHQQQPQQEEQQQSATALRGFCDYPDFGYRMREQYNSPKIYTTESNYTSSNDAFFSAMTTSTVAKILGSDEQESIETAATTTTTAAVAAATSSSGAKEETSTTTATSSYWNYVTPSINAFFSAIPTSATFMSIENELPQTKQEDRNAVAAAAAAATTASASSVSKECEQPTPKCRDEYYETRGMMEEYIPPTCSRLRRSPPLHRMFTTPDDSILDDSDNLLDDVELKSYTPPPPLSLSSSPLPMPTVTSTTTTTTASTSEGAETTHGGTFSEDSDEYRSLEGKDDNE